MPQCILNPFPNRLSLHNPCNDLLQLLHSESKTIISIIDKLLGLSMMLLMINQPSFKERLLRTSFSCASPDTGYSDSTTNWNLIVRTLDEIPPDNTMSRAYSGRIDSYS
ncbi:hypothetical protein EB093_02155 [bacterium]|nr:hypothetical protein [bacterium]